MTGSRVIGFVMAGGEGRRLRPFTQGLPKPALSFAGSHRIIDFALSNFYNSAIRSVFVLLEYQPETLIGQLAENWAFANDGGNAFVVPVQSRNRGGDSGFRGTADSVGQCLALLDERRVDVVSSTNPTRVNLSAWCCAKRAGDIQIKVVDIELLTIQIRLLVCSVDKAREMGIDWWATNSHLYQTIFSALPCAVPVFIVQLP